MGGISRGARLAGVVWLVSGAMAAAGCQADGHGQESSRTVGPDTIVLQSPDAFGAAERPPTEFDHAAHVTALGGDESCTQCHAEREGHLDFHFSRVGEVTDRESLREAYHEGCIGCHEDRSGQQTGPTACGECHRSLPEGVSERAPMRWDLSLHQRHARVFGDRCETCHHDIDPETGERVANPGHEQACADCHGDQPRVIEREGHQVRLGTLAEISHEACVNCHRDRARQHQSTGPVACEACHSQAAQARIERLDPIPRLERGQPDNRWIRADGATSKLVAFDHRGHEAVTARCSTCHHHGLQKCSDCHTVTGSPEGGGVTLEQAFHDPRSERSCVGCHEHHAMADQSCAGCHANLHEVPTEASCSRCHAGPTPNLAELTTPAAPTQAPNTVSLPEPSEDFPTEVTIGRLAERFQPARFPHRRIVEALARRSQDSSLAFHFHGQTSVACSGCHHHTPEGERPPSCATCHSTDQAQPTRDQPRLVAAYHRQCIGCHQQMGIDTRCETCHEPAQGRPR